MLRSRETEETIYSWQLNTFGNGATDLAIAKRAAKEMAELVEKLESGAPLFEVLVEAADVDITLVQLFGKYGMSKAAFVDHKMGINRNRVWARTADGCSQHVPQPGDADFRVKESTIPAPSRDRYNGTHAYPDEN